MAWDETKPTDDGLLINFPGQCRANWDAIALLTDADLLITNAKVAADAAIVESKLTFAGAGHGHAGDSDGKLIDLTDAITGILPIANGGWGAAAQVIENLTEDPGAPATGQIWFRTDV